MRITLTLVGAWPSGSVEALSMQLQQDLAGVTTDAVGESLEVDTAASAADVVNALVRFLRTGAADDAIRITTGSGEPSTLTADVATNPIELLMIVTRLAPPTGLG